ncbi:MAG: NADH-quinone oxidoreductase subunit A [Pyrobaculum sp.]
MEDAVAVALAFGLVFYLMISTIYLAMFIAPRRPTPYKQMRYEAGNLEAGPAKAPLAMQYLGYLLMLVALEPAAAIPIAVYLFLHDIAATAVAALVGILITLAATIYAYRYAKEVNYWRIG